MFENKTVPAPPPPPLPRLLPPGLLLVLHVNVPLPLASAIPDIDEKGDETAAPLRPAVFIIMVLPVPFAGAEENDAADAAVVDKYKDPKGGEDEVEAELTCVGACRLVGELCGVCCGLPIGEDVKDAADAIAEEEGLVGEEEK